MNYHFDTIIRRENTCSVKYDLRDKYFGRADVLPLWVADMDFATPDFIRQAVIKRAEQAIYGYSVRPEEFQKSICAWMKKKHNWEIDANWICFSPGIVPALNMSVLAYTNPGDKILIQPPVYFPFFGAVKDHGRTLTENVLRNEKGSYGIDFADFEQKASESKVFILCHPHNPVGRMWNEHELERMLKICRDNNTLILSDEIHSDIILSGKAHIPLLSLEGSHENTLAMYAPSKTFNLAGLSTSFLVIPDKRLREGYEKTLNNLHLSMGNIFGAEALIAAYRDGEQWLNELLTYLRGNLSFLEDFIQKYIPEIKVTIPEATYLVWLDFRELGWKDEDIKNFLINEAGIGLNHGPVFGKGGEGFQRMNIALPKSRLTEALQQLRMAVDRKKNNTGNS